MIVSQNQIPPIKSSGKNHPNPVTEEYKYLDTQFRGKRAERKVKYSLQKVKSDQTNLLGIDFSFHLICSFLYALCNFVYFVHFLDHLRPNQGVKKCIL